jgi:conjugative relaxase-like TrwC/TraI family protein
MLSTKPFRSSSSAQKYYSHADYYGAEAQGEWYGKGAEELDLSGNFNAKDNKSFEDILNGKLPNGIQLGNKINGDINHRPGIDLTFSSPKSFSVQLLIFADKEEKKALETARINAVHNTLKYIENSGLVYTRLGYKGIEKEDVNKLVFALFPHTTNRNLEPQDHVHCLLANVAKCNDGQFRSIVWDKIFENNKFIGQIFRNELALQVKKLGYEIETRILPDGSSSFELKNISQKLIDAFSTRRKEIETLCKQLGIVTKEGRDKVVINSRKAKQSISKEELIKAWQEVVKSVELEKDKSDIIKKPLTVLDALSKLKDFISTSLTNNIDPTIKLSSDDIAMLCLDDVSYHNSLFSKEELMSKALKYSIGTYSINDIQKSLDKLIINKKILVGDNKLTSKELFDKEIYILEQGKQGLNTCKPIIPTNIFNYRYKLYANNIQGFKLNTQQKQAVKHIVTSKDKITAIQGLPGVGKSTVLDTVRQMTNSNIIELLGAAPTSSAAKTLTESASIKSRTLHSFIGQYKGYLEGRGTKRGLHQAQSTFKNSMIFVDEASLISTKMMYNLIKLSDILKFRIVLIGDTKQLAAVEAGKPFEQLLDVIKSAKLTKILRQRDDQHKQAIISASENKVHETFLIHQSNIKESGNNLIFDVVKQYMSLSQVERNSTLLISPTKADRNLINTEIIKQLRQEGYLKGEIYKADILKQRDVTKADYNFANSYKVGDMVKFYADYKSLGINKSDYLEVKKINEISNIITFNKGLKTIRFGLKTNVNYESKLELYQKDNIELQKGIKLRITKNEQGLVNSETAVVESISNKQITLRLENNTFRSFKTDELKHIDYGYCSTIHAAQGKTYNNAIAAISSHKLLNNQKSWLVAISRHKQDLHVFMDSQIQVQKQLINNKGIVSSALEIHQVSK